MDKNRIITILLLLAIVCNLVISGVLTLKDIDQDKKLEMHRNAIINFSNGLELTDKRVIETMNAHNKEVESWYVGNKYIEDVTNKFFDGMRTLNDAGNLTEFNLCIEDYDNYYTLLVPHINSDDYVEGYAMQMYDMKNVNPLGYMIFTKEYTEYAMYPCGGYLYNKTTDEMSEL